MKKIIFLTTVLLAAVWTVAGFSQDMFRIGASWRTNIYSTESNPAVETGMIQYIDAVVDIDGVECLTLMEKYADYDAESKLVTYLRTEGNKVWFMSNLDTKEWKLMYDFGLEPGDECVVGYGIYPAWGDRTVRCLSITPAEDYPDIMRMEMGTVDEKGEIDSYWDIGYWLVGVGSESGVMRNVPEVLVGLGHVLVEASVDGEVLYVNKAMELCPITTSTDTDSRCFDLNGREISKPVPGQVYVMDGKLHLDVK